MRTVRLSCHLAAPVEDVWAAAVTEAGIDDELRPVLRMRMPRRWRGSRLDEVPVGAPLGRAWLLLLGVLPVEYDDLSLAAVGPGACFTEESRMLLLSPWRHHRRVTPAPGGCEVHDELSFRARLAPLTPLAALVVRALFRHRHRRLTRRWGAVTRLATQ